MTQNFNMEKFIGIICRHPKKTILIIFSLFVIASPLLKHLNFTDDYKEFTGSDNAKVMFISNLEEEFSKFKNIYFMFEPSNGEVFSQTSLDAIIDITEEAWLLPNVKRVDSLTNFQHTIVEQDDLIVADFIEKTETTSHIALRQKKQIAITHPEMLNYFINADASATALNIEFEIADNDTENSRKSWQAVNELREEFTKKHPSIKVSTSGVVALTNGWLDAIVTDIKFVIPLAFCLIFIGISILFKNISAGIITLIVALGSAVATLIFLSFMHMVIVPITSSGIIIIVILAVADCTHIISSANQHVRQGMQKERAIVEGIMLNMRGLLLTTITTAAGFLSFLNSEFIAIVTLGYYVAFGIFFAFILAVTLLPAMLCFTTLGRHEHIIPTHAFKALSRFSIKYRVALLCLTGPAVLISGYLSLQNTVNDSLSDHMSETRPYNISIKRIEDKLTGAATLLYGIHSKSGLAITDPKFIREVDDFAQWFRQQPETRFVRSYTDILKRLNQNLNYDNKQFYKLPENQELAAQYLLLYEMSLAYGMDLTNQINLDKTGVVLNININNLSVAEFQDINKRATLWLAANALDIDTQTSGLSFVMSELMYDNFFELLMGALIALAVICIILMLALKSFYTGIICSIGVLAPIWACFGAWAITNGEIGLAASYVISMAVGIAVDNSVHFMSKYLQAIKASNNKADAITYAISQVGEAITVNTIVLGACFATLISSAFKLYSVMGLMTVITLVLALLTTFFLLPSLLMLDMPWKKKLTI